MTTGVTPARGTRRVGSPARVLARGMTTMTTGAAVASTAAGTAGPEVTRKMRAAAGTSGRARSMMTTMTSGAVVAVTAVGTAIPGVTRRLHAAAGMSVRALPALATVMRTTTGEA